MIPAFFAAPVALAGLAARREGWRKHAMHAALLMALLGAGGALSRAVPAVLAGELRLASISQLLMGVGLLVCLALCAIVYPGAPFGRGVNFTDGARQFRAI